MYVLGISVGRLPPLEDVVEPRTIRLPIETFTMWMGATKLKTFDQDGKPIVGVFPFIPAPHFVFCQRDNGRFALSPACPARSRGSDTTCLHRTCAVVVLDVVVEADADIFRILGRIDYLVKSNRNEERNKKEGTKEGTKEGADTAVHGSHVN